MSRPSDRKGVRSVLGMAGFYCRFVASYAVHAEPLTRLLKKENEFVWGQEQKRAFGALKEILAKPPILSFPDRQQKQILTTDGSGEGLSAILSQVPEDGGDETVIAYALRVVRGAEKSYAATHLEALTLVWAANKFRHYLAGRKFLVRTDHSSLRFIFGPHDKPPSPKIQRWAAAMMEYDFSVEYIKGESNPADALSRLL